MVFEVIPSLEELDMCLQDPLNPIGMRMRAAYYLRHIHSTTPDQKDDVVRILQLGLLNKDHGSLLRHEFAYVMGQMKDTRVGDDCSLSIAVFLCFWKVNLWHLFLCFYTLPQQSCHVLEQVLSTDDDCVMVRHECAEALGAIGSETSQSVLEEVCRSYKHCPELSDTCQLALDVIKWRSQGGDPDDYPSCACMRSPYSSVDPAPPHPSHQALSAKELGDLLCQPTLSMFERYRAMFSLRNKGGADCVRQLARALTTDTTSPLLRHEVAYVLGQMQHPDSVEALATSLRRLDEHVMVRHESAEALGAIEGRWEDCERILREFSSDSDLVVRESCIVALDAGEYWGHITPTDSSDDQTRPSSSVFSKEKNNQPPNRILVGHFNVI
jgi:deoxyhypusine monooxygenase